MAGDHPDAIKLGPWTSDEPLYCLNTSDNKIPVYDLIFLDYDETTDGDKDDLCVSAKLKTAGESNDVAAD